MPQARKFEYVSCTYSFAETEVSEADGLLNAVFGIPEAELFSEDAEVLPRAAPRLYRAFTRKMEEACREVRGRDG